MEVQFRQSEARPVQQPEANPKAATIGHQVSYDRSAALLLGAWLAVFPIPAGGAEPSKTNSPPASSTNLTAITASEIAGQAEAALADLRVLGTAANPDPALDQIQEALPQTEQEIAARAEENARILTHGSSLELFGRLEGGWHGVSQQLSDWDHSLTRHAKQLEGDAEHLQQVLKRWEITKQTEQNTVPAELSNRIDQVIGQTTKANANVQQELGTVLKLQNRVSEQEVRVHEAVSAIDLARQQIMRHLLVRDSPVLWSHELSDNAAQKLASQSQSSLARQRKELRSYWGRRRERFLLQILIFAGLAGLLSRAHHRLSVRSLTQEELEPTARSLGAPVASALLLTLLLSPWLYPQAPRLWWSLLGSLALVPAWIVLRRLLAAPLHGLVSVLALFYLVDQLRNVAAAQPLLWRLLFLAEMAAACLYCWVLLRGRFVPESQARTALARLAISVLRVATGLFGLALLANILGYGRISSLVGNVQLSAAYLALLLYAVVRVGEALVRVLLHASAAAHLGVVKRCGPLLEHRVRQALQWTAAGAWLLYLLQRLALQHSLGEVLKHALTAPLSVGSLNFTLGHLLLFALAIWAAFLVSRLLRFLLEEEIYPHLRLAPGLHYSISKTLHYVILLVGFLLGLAMLGFNLTKLTILAGAFGVGLGFGMQNIVSNFVSGIILLFERPVKVGDVIQLDGTEGVVKRIGIRASIVRTQNGSEIIVPNAKLISDPVTNWTFSQRRRLITMPIAVTSETEPQKVLALLQRVADGHPRVSKDAQALLTKLNDGTAAYELRAWTDQSENWEQVRSDLFMSIKSSLAAEGIAMR